MASQSFSRVRTRSAGHIGPLLATALTLYGCSTLEHGYSAADVAGASLSTATPEGEQRLQIEADYDSAIQDLISWLGRPEYLHIIDRENLYLFYTELDRVAVVRRFVWSGGHANCANSQLTTRP